MLPNPSKDALSRLKKIISEKDAPILAAAEGSDYLLTLDNEFFGERIAAYARSKNFLIVKPKDLILL